MRRAAYLTLSAMATGAVIALMCCGQSQAASAPPELVAVAREVASLPPGPGGLGRDCVWRTDQIVMRLSPRYRVLREIVSAGSLCHSVAGVLLNGQEWLVDGQTGRVWEVHGRWGGPLYMGGCV